MKPIKLLAIMLLAVLPVANAGVYKYVDEDGNVHFTDTPPPKQKTEEVKVQRAATPTVQGTASIAARGAATEDEVAEEPSDRELCSKAVSNLRRFVPAWERKIRAKMPDMPPEERAAAEQSLVQLKNNMRRLNSGLSQCVREMDNSAHRGKTECMANAENDTMAMFCVM
ncbi:MAG: DUF4124 domain-containing protein [Woeseiaceae bacterium]